MAFSNYLLNKLNQLIFGNTAFTPPATIFVGLSTTTPNPDGTNVTEPSAANGYGRVAVTNDTSHWHTTPGQPPTGERQSNVLAVAFAQATGVGWGNVTYVVLYDAASGGNFLGFGQLSPVQNIVAGDTFSFNIDQLTTTMQ